jgi:hypothetical protein
MMIKLVQMVKRTNGEGSTFFNTITLRLLHSRVQLTPFLFVFGFRTAIDPNDKNSFCMILVPIAEALHFL